MITERLCLYLATYTCIPGGGGLKHIRDAVSENHLRKARGSTDGYSPSQGSVHDMSFDDETHLGHANPRTHLQT